MNLGIFILHYASDRITERCLESFIPQAKVVGAAIYVIDNGSPEPFPGQKGVLVIRLSENHFLIDAFNQAMQQHPHDAYLAVTNDTYAYPGLVEGLLDELNCPEVGIVAPGTNDLSVGPMYVPYPGNWTSLQVAGVDNVCWGWRQDLVDKIGWPDCAGHIHRACWGSNQDYCYRARQAGYKILAVRRAYLEHAHNGGQDQVAWQAGREWLRRKWQKEAPNVWM